MASDFGCHRERPSGREGSAVSSQPSFRCQQKQIPRFARNDNTRHRKRAAHCRPPRAEGASSNAVIDVRLRCVRRHHRRNVRHHHHRNGHRHRRSAIRLHRLLRRRHRPRSAAPSKPGLRYGHCNPGLIHSCGPRRSRKLTDTIRGCFLRRSHFQSQPIHIAKRASRPARRDTRIQQAAWLTPTLWCGAPSQSCYTRCRYGGCCLANHPANCLAELHVVTAPLDATEPTAAPFRWAGDTCSSRVAAAPGSCAPSPLLVDRGSSPGLADCGSSSSRCSLHLHCLAQNYRSAPAAAVRCARHFPDSRSPLHRVRARRSDCPAS